MSRLHDVPVLHDPLLAFDCLCELDLRRPLCIHRPAREDQRLMATAIGIAQQVEWDVREQTGLWKDAWVRFRRNRLAVAGLVVIIVMIVLAIGARLPTAPGGLWHILHLTGDP